MGKRVKTPKYTKEEIRGASRQFMKSLNMINQKSLKFTPEITNSLGKTRLISKSAAKRRARKQKADKAANLGGVSMDNLADALNVAQQQVPEKKHAGLIDPHKNQKNNKRVFDNEINNYKKQAGLSLNDIKARLEAAKSAESQ